jgi:DNA-binding response OmpR family regulator
MTSLSPSRVLVADAEPLVRRQLFSALLEQNVFSDCVATAREGLSKLAGEQYGVVVLDVTLPEEEIDEVMQRIAGQPSRSRPVVIVLAANPERANTLDVEVVQIVLRRPVHLRQLVDVIVSCLRAARNEPQMPVPSPPPADQPIS